MESFGDNVDVAAVVDVVVVVVVVVDGAVTL